MYNSIGTGRFVKSNSIVSGGFVSLTVLVVEDLLVYQDW